MSNTRVNSEQKDGDKRGHSTLCRNMQKFSLRLTAKYPFLGGHENKTTYVV